MARIAYIRWLDAHWQEGEHAIESINGRCELEDVGFIVKQTADAVVLSLERPQNGRTRNPFAIPRTGILELRMMPLRRVFPLARKRTTVSRKANS